MAGAVYAVGQGRARRDRQPGPAPIATSSLLRRAVKASEPEPDYVLTDGFPVPRIPCPSLGIKKGDAVAASVAAASIVAKVTRDRIMDRMHRRYPEFGFDHNMGYGTPDHLEVLDRLGPTPIHRLSFACVGQPSLPGPRHGVGGVPRTVRSMRHAMSDDDIERFEEERELELYREYRDVLPMFTYVIETERRFYLANKVDVAAHGRRLGPGRPDRRLGVGHVPPGAVRLQRPGDDPPRRQRRGARPSRRDHDDPRHPELSPERLGASALDPVSDPGYRRAMAQRGRRPARRARRHAAVTTVHRGYRVVARNWRCRIGELDLVAHARRHARVLRGEDPSRLGVRRRLRGRRRPQAQKVRAWPRSSCMRTEASPEAVRFDVASVWLRPDGSARSSSSRTPSEIAGGLRSTRRRRRVSRGSSRSRRAGTCGREAS